MKNDPYSIASLARKMRLHMVQPSSLTIRRKQSGEHWDYLGARGQCIRDPHVIRRLNALAVPPAYQDVRYASDVRAHLQAVGRDAAGRLQYRYHRDWEKIREIRKAQKLIGLIEVLPKIRRALSSRLNLAEPSKEFAFSALIELIAQSAIRAGCEEYARTHHTRGAATLLKSNVHCEGDGRVELSFKGKGGKSIKKETTDATLCAAIARLRKLPGARLFQYLDADGKTHPVTAAAANAFLKEIAGCNISLKDFRTLCGTAEALGVLAAVEPANSAGGRKKQIKAAILQAAEKLENTPAVCRKSYVHPAVVTAFEAGLLRGFADKLRRARSETPACAAVAILLEKAA
jgi:DNA topoisomerase-1